METESRDNLHLPSETYSSYASDVLNRILVTFFSSLSVLGSSLIIGSYLRWKDIRTSSRRILVCISTSDLLVSGGCLVGNLLPKQLGENDHASCVAQSFITSSASITSFMWSTSLAIYLHLTLVKNHQTRADRLIPVFHVFNWIIGPVINIIALAKRVLGYSSEVTAGWCWIKHNRNQDKRTEEIVWMLFDGKLWEIVAMILILVLYFFVKVKIRDEVTNNLFTTMACPFILH